MISSLLYYVIFLIISFYFLFFVLFICFRIIVLYATENPMLEDHSNKPTKNVPTLIYPKKYKFHCQKKKMTPQHLSKLVNKNTILNLSIASCFLNILASPNVSTWSTTGGPINKTIKHLGLTRHHRKTIERTWHVVNQCKEMEQEYTGNNFTRHFNPHYLLSNSDELNILTDSMGNILGLRYTTHLINCHRHQNFFDELCKSNVNLSFLRLQPKRTRI